MKKIKFTLFLCLILASHTVLSQSTIKPIEDLLGAAESDYPNTYFKDTNHKLQDCVGTWLYDNGTDYFLITFTKAKQKINPYYYVYCDVLTTKFYYRKNGVVIYDNLNVTPSPGSNSKPSDISSDFVKNSSISFLYLEPTFNDCNIRRRGGMLNIELINNGQQMSWVAEINPYSFDDEPCENGVLPDDSPYQIPANMILNRVN